MSNFKDALDSLYSLFESGKKAMDITYSIKDKVLIVESMDIHEIYKWENKKDPVYFSYNHTNKVMRVTNLTAGDLKDETLLTFLALPKQDSLTNA